MKDAAYLNDLLYSIDTIIFDLGGVIVNIDYMKTQHAFEELGLTSFGEVYSQAAQSGLFDLYEKGLADTATFNKRLRLLVPDFEVSDNDLADAWNAMILELPSRRLDTLARLKSFYRTFLLSNTNELHIEYLHSRLKMEYGKENLNDYFEKVYYSYEIHLRKPDREIFEHVLRENGLDPQKTLFIDDTIRHIESAQSIGIHTIHIGSDIMLDELYVVLQKRIGI